MTSKNRDNEMFSKLLELDVAVKDKLDEQHIEKIIQNSSIIDSLGENGMTALHFSQHERWIEVSKLLLRYGVDYTSKNSLGSTALHAAMERAYEHETYTAFSLMKASHDFADLILSAHIQTKDFNNPCNNNGISHFHAACTVDNVEAVRYFLDNGVSVDQPIDASYSFLPGYTALHIAVEYCNLEIVPVLLQYNADVHARNSEGLNPVHMWFKQKIKLCNYMLDHSESINKLVKKKLEISDQILHLMLQKYSLIDDIGLSHLHIACVMANSSLANHLLQQHINIDHSLNMDSPIFAGYTALHFAVQFNIDTAKLLIVKGANMQLKNSNGLTPLDLCLQKYKVEPLHSILSCHPVWKDIFLVDNKIKLMDLIYALRGLNHFKSFLQNVRLNVEKALIPSNSPLWPGYTLLHLVITLSNKRECFLFIEQLVNVGCDVDAQDMRGETALHKAAKFCNYETVSALIKVGADLNVVDKSGKTALTYTFEYNSRNTQGLLLQQVIILQLCQLYVCQINKDIQASKSLLWGNGSKESLLDEIEKANDAKIGDSLTLRRFLSDDTISAYPYTSLQTRNDIRAFVTSIDKSQFRVLKSVIKMQFRQAEKRINLVEEATGSLRSLSNCPVPDVCSRIIFESLKNADLESLIVAAFEDT